MNPTLYDILGVSRDASRDEIRKAWRESADRFEPGEGGSTKQFRLFNEAAEVLLDPERRKAYDERLAGQDAPAGEAPAETSASPAEPSKVSSVSLAKPPKGAAEEGAKAGAADAPPAQTVPAPPMPGTARATTQPVAVPGDRSPADEGRAENGPEAPSRGPTVSVPVLAALAAVTALVVGLATYFVVQAQRAEDYRDALDRAPAAAENAAAAVLSYGYESLEADRDAAAKFLSDGYRKEYVETFDKLVQDGATQTKATVEAQVLASSAMTVGEERDPDRVPVLLFVNQSTTSTASSGEPSVALNRVRFDMVRSDGAWLVDGITSY